MKKLKLITTLTALGSIAAATPVVVTGCSSTTQNFDSIKFMDDEIYHTEYKRSFPAEEAYNFAAAQFSATKGNEICEITKISAKSYNTDAIEITNATDSSFTLNTKATATDVKVEITVEDAKGNKGTATSKITVTPAAANQLTIAPSMSEKGTEITNQAAYVTETNTVRAYRGATFLNNKTVDVQFVLTKAVNNLDPANDLQATITGGEEPIEAKNVSFAWTDGTGTDKTKITMSLNDAAYKLIPVHNALSVTVGLKSKTDFEACSFNLKKGHYAMENPAPGKNSGGYINAGDADESLIKGTWNGVDTTNYPVELEISAPDTFTGFTITKWSGRIGLLKTGELEVVADGSKPTEGVPYLQLPSGGVTAGTVTLIIPQGVRLPDKTVYIRAKDATGHVATIHFDVAGITTTCEAQSSGTTVATFVDGYEINIDKLVEEADSLVFAKASTITGTVATWKAYIGDKWIPKTLTNATLSIGTGKDLDPKALSDQGEQIVVYGYSDAAATKVLCTFVFTASGTQK